MTSSFSSPNNYCNFSCVLLFNSVSVQYLRYGFEGPLVVSLFSLMCVTVVSFITLDNTGPYEFIYPDLIQGNKKIKLSYESGYIHSPPIRGRCGPVPCWRPSYLREGPGCNYVFWDELTWSNHGGNQSDQELSNCLAASSPNSERETTR